MTQIYTEQQPVSTQISSSDLAPAQDIIARATELIPLLRESAAQSSADRKVTPEMMQALENAELFGLLVPKRLGGDGANMRTALETIAEVARGDGSTAWTVSLLNVCAWFASTFSAEAQQEVFGNNPRAKVSGIFTPGSKAEPVDGGYLISGQWPFASGSFAADWATLGMTIPDMPEGEDPRALALVPKEAWTIKPTWFVAGMRGSGSDTIVIEDHFVPHHRVQRLPEMAEARFMTPFQAEERNSNMAFYPVAALILVGAQVGLARHALEITREKLPSKRVAYSIYTEARNSPAHQLGVAKAANQFHMAELLLAQAARDIDQAAATRTVSDLVTRGRIRHDTGIVAELVKNGINDLMTANGAGSFADVNLLNRIWRDSEIAGRHALVTPELGKELYGRLLLGADDPLTTDV